LNLTTEIESSNWLVDVPRCPTEEYETRIGDVSKENCVIVSERTVAMNKITPKLKGLVKLHKEARPMRPLVNCTQSPC